MSKKLLTFITILVLLLVFVGGGTFLYLYTKNQNSDGSQPTISETLKKMNPFGSSVSTEIKNTVNKIIPNTFTSSSTDTGTEEKILELEPVLFKLSDERSSGVDFADILIPKTIEVRKKILVDDPLAKPGTTPKKISVMASTTETVYGTTTRLRFVEQATGHIFEYDYASTTMRKLTNTTIPKTQEALFLNNGSKVLLRYLDSSGAGIENYLASIPVSSVTDGLTGSFLNGNIQNISASPDTKQFFYIAKTQNGSIGNIYDTTTNIERRVFSSPFSEWLPEWRGSNIYLTTKAHSTFGGVLYAQNTLKNNFSKVLGYTFGLTTNTSPDTKKVLIGSGLYLTVLNIQTGTKIPLSGIYTLPEKCIWYDEVKVLCFGQDNQPEGTYPEWWYQGRMSFNDSLYSIDTETGEVTKLATMSELYKETVYIDAYSIHLSKDKKYISLLNKIDMSPWYLDIGKFLDYIEIGE